jgi:hypothetical protein
MSHEGFSIMFAIAGVVTPENRNGIMLFYVGAASRRDLRAAWLNIAAGRRSHNKLLREQ